MYLESLNNLGKFNLRNGMAEEHVHLTYLITYLHLQVLSG